ncbi:MAG: permease-like cell division protein FtsX [Ferruginibacter sp.]
MRTILILLISFLCIFSCNQNKEIDFHKTEWKPVDTTGYYEYFATKITSDSAANKRVVLKIVGWLSNVNNNIDSATNKVDFISPIPFFSPIPEAELTGYGFAKLLGENSSGYIKMNYKKYLLDNYKNENHFTVYFPVDYSLENLQKDSAHLSDMKIFKEINILTAEKAANKFSDETDSTWKKFLDGNPLPVSLELKMNESLLQKNKFDSVERLLEKELPTKTEIVTSGIKKIMSNDFDKNATLIFKFIIF